MKKPYIAILSVSDHQIGHVLCRAELWDASITVSVNRDHPLIKLATQARPTNRALLNQIVFGEIASSAAASAEFAAAALTSTALKKASNVADLAERQRLILRILTDNTKAAA